MIVIRVYLSLKILGMQQVDINLKLNNISDKYRISNEYRMYEYKEQMIEDHSSQ